ncbi:MAG TPA: DUF1697 domain-containing protein [Streptosporangiaceae bacterium]|nr:DUF1697 domain-containing protein [Streptosporangiaceae bacterium]
MPTHVALLRGINVGGRNKVAMADLRAVLTSLGHADVATYIQSGNVVFSTAETDTAALAAAIEGAIAERLDVWPRVVVLSRGDLAQVVADNPHPGEPNPKALHAVFLDTDPDPDVVAAVAVAQDKAAQQGSRDTAQFVGRTMFLHTPDGFGRSELAVLLGRASGPLSPRGVGTARNWATVARLLDLCDS